MSTGFLALACFSASIVFFAFSIKLEKAGTPRSYASYSPVRQKKIQAARWVFFSVGVVMLATAVLLEWFGLKS